MNAARDGRLSLIVGWGPFGHRGSYSPAAQFPPCEAALQFPWMTIRKNEAYPVFTNATTNDVAPWPIVGGKDADKRGQYNAYFRWTSIEDSPDAIAMRLWLECPPRLRGTVNLSVADVTLRRLQRLKIHPEKSYHWTLSRDGKTVGSGVVKPDAAGLLTVPKATITTAPAELRLTPQ